MSLQCYNKGCGQKFDPDSNSDGVCRYHPGVPVFHDALKGWSCCKKRSTDFTEFLNIPGCTTGPHSNIKPPEPAKSQVIEDVPEETPAVVETPINNPISSVERPSADEPKVNLPVTVASSLKHALEKKLKEMSLYCEQQIQEIRSVDQKTVTAGTSCKNNACKASYVDENSNNEICKYHPGVPVFHEGCKFWTCCMRRTSDFDAFLNQEGCETGVHVWFKPESESQKPACRYDWHQTGSFVTISVFAKVCDPKKSFVSANQVSAQICIVFEDGKSIFNKELVLNGVIDLEKSNVKMLGTKVEINLKKAVPGSWSSLELPQQTEQETENSDKS